MFTITSDSVLSQIENSGCARISFKVDGYWSSDQINVRISRRFSDGWTIEESHSSGGECSKFQGSNGARTRNFAEAMSEAADIMTEWEMRTEELEAAYEQYRDKINLMYKQQDARKKRVEENSF